MHLLKGLSLDGSRHAGAATAISLIRKWTPPLTTLSRSFRLPLELAERSIPDVTISNHTISAPDKDASFPARARQSRPACWDERSHLGLQRGVGRGESSRVATSSGAAEEGRGRGRPYQASTVSRYVYLCVSHCISQMSATQPTMWWPPITRHLRSHTCSHGSDDKAKAKARG